MTKIVKDGFIGKQAWLLATAVMVFKGSFFVLGVPLHLFDWANWYIMNNLFPQQDDCASSLWLRLNEKKSLGGTGLESLIHQLKSSCQGITFLTGIIFLIDHLAAIGSQYSGDLIRAHKNHYCSHWGHYQETLNVL